MAIASPPSARLNKEPEPPSETDLMLKALTADRGESPNAARIERVSAQVRADSLRKRSTVTTVWKDPFAEDPDREVVVRMPTPRRQRGNEVAVMRRELARARAETASAQAEAAAAQAEAAQAKANSARSEAIAARAQAIAARHEAAAARAQCTEPEKAKRVVRSRSSEGASGMGQLALAVSRETPARPRLATKTRSQRPGPAKVAAASEPAPAVDDRPEPPPPAPETLAPPAPPGSIIVVPITR